MNWLEVTVETESAAVETVCAILHEHGEGGVAVHQEIVPDDENGAYHYDTSLPTAVTTYVPATADGLRRRDAIAAALGHLTAFNLAHISAPRTREVAQEDWAHAWKEFYYPMRFGRRLIVKPSWREVTPGPTDLVIELDPGMAFGTGLHQTTAMCLTLLEDYVQPGMSVLDQGSGSGILALAAARLGASLVAAADISEVAVAATNENAARNRLDHVITALRCATVPGVASGTGVGAPVKLRRKADAPAESAAPRAEYDLIVANIIADVIIDLASRLAEALTPDGVLIASGIINTREDDVRSALAGAGFGVERRKSLDEWVALVARRVDPEGRTCA